MRERLRDVIWWAGLVAIALACVYVARGKSQFVSDDAYISFRYAWNLAHGNGLVWNTHMPPVEGYSNLLWTLGAALGIAVGMPIVPWAQGIGIALTVAAALAAAGCVRVVGGGRSAALAAALLSALSTLSTRWAVAGLETPLLTALLTVGLWRALVEDAAARAGASGPAGVSPRRWSILLFGLASITHVEGPLYLAIPVIVRLARVRVEPLRRRDWVNLGALCAPALAQELLRVGYYGDPVPNTFHVKVTGGGTPWPTGALRYLLAAVSWNRTLSAAWGIGALAVLGSRRRLLLLPALAVAGFVLVANGDEFSHLRFIAPAIPTLSAATAAGFDALARWRTSRVWRAAWALAAVLIVGRSVATDLAVFQIVVREPVPAAGRHGPPVGWAALGPPWVEAHVRGIGAAPPPPPPAAADWFVTWLVERLPVDESFLFLDVGFIGYVMAGNDLLDGRGLSWRAMAELVQSPIPAGPTGLQAPALVTMLDELRRSNPAALVLQCNGGQLFGQVEAALQADGTLADRYRFVVSGAYTGEVGSVCIYARSDVQPPSRAAVVARYQRLLREVPGAWAARLAEVEAGTEDDPASAWESTTAPVLATPGRYDPEVLKAPARGGLDRPAAKGRRPPQPDR